jgi:hypothetical protein
MIGKLLDHEDDAAHIGSLGGVTSRRLTPRRYREARLRVMGKGVHDLRGVIAAAGHALHTKALGPEGEVTGELPEQVPYQEWLHSHYISRTLDQIGWR